MNKTLALLYLESSPLVRNLRGLLVQTTALRIQWHRKESLETRKSKHKDVKLCPHTHCCYYGDADIQTYPKNSHIARQYLIYVNFRETEGRQQHRYYKYQISAKISKLSEGFLGKHLLGLQQKADIQNSECESDEEERLIFSYSLLLTYFMTSLYDRYLTNEKQITCVEDAHRTLSR